MYTYLGKERGKEICAFIDKSYNNFDLESAKTVQILSEFKNNYKCKSLAKIGDAVKNLLKTYKF